MSQRITNKVFGAVNKLRIKNKPCGIDDARKLEVYFKNYQITIINKVGKFNKVPLYAGKRNKKHIYLSYTDSHYNVIKSIKRFYNRSYYRSYCLVSYNNLLLLDVLTKIRNIPKSCPMYYLKLKWFHS